MCLNKPNQPNLTLPSHALDAGTSAGGVGASRAALDRAGRLCAHSGGGGARDPFG